MATGKKHGECDCGNIATMRKRGLPVCERCNAIEQMHLNDLRHKPDMKNAPSNDYYATPRRSANAAMLPMFEYF